MAEHHWPHALGKETVLLGEINNVEAVFFRGVQIVHTEEEPFRGGAGL